MPMTSGVYSPRTRSSLKALGFNQPSRGEGYRHNGVSFNNEHQWSILQTTSIIENVDPLAGQLGWPGLWKYVATADGKEVRRIFDLPRQVLALEDEPEDSEEDHALACLKWALATDEGKLPEGWQPPPRAEVEAWIPPQGLILQSGPLLRQGELIHTPERLAVRFAIVPNIPGDLSHARREWLRELLVEGQNRWRMVRIGWSEDGADAEVDLSGAPLGVLEPLFRTGLDALRWVVGWLVWPAAFLVDTQIECRTWEECPLRAEPAERRVVP